jgi:hypothetical protein
MQTLICIKLKAAPLNEAGHMSGAAVQIFIK